MDLNRQVGNDEDLQSFFIPNLYGKFLSGVGSQLHPRGDNYDTHSEYILRILCPTAIPFWLTPIYNWSESWEEHVVVRVM